MGFIGKFIQKYLVKKNIDMLYYSSEDRKKVFSLTKKIKSEVDFLLGYTEAFNIYAALQATKKVGGVIAEVGSYQGGSAKLIAETIADKEIYIFDTFAGLPEVTEADKGLDKGSYSASYEKVKEYLKDYSNIKIHKGVFPDSAKEVEEKKFSFVHLDVDTYQSTLACLRFFYNKMNKGGVMVSHDYACQKGVTQAFDEFFRDKEEVVIALPGTQCLVVKL